MRTQWIKPLLLLFSSFAAFAAIANAVPASASPGLEARQLPDNYNNHVVFTPPANYTKQRTLYARSLQLPDGSLLVTWENYSPEPPPVHFPIYRSTDGGVTWAEQGRVEDQVHGWGMRYQPFLYLLDTEFGGYPAGTVLLAGSAITTDLSQISLDLYASTDSGSTWEFVSTIATGSDALPENGLPAVWEPFLMMYGDELVCFFADQRDPDHGQKLVHQTTGDLVSWSDPVDDVAYPTYTDRPGMPVVTYISPTETYFLIYEYGGGAVDGETGGDYKFPIFYRMAANPLKFNDVEGVPIVTNDSSRTVPIGSPYVVWATTDNGAGMLLASAGSHSEVFVNDGNADVGSWQIRESGEDAGYTRCLRIVELEGEEKVFFANGGPLEEPEDEDESAVTVGLIDKPVL